LGDATLQPQIPKVGESADPEHPQPEAAEVESARLLANAAREALADRGDRVDDERLRRLADEFVSTGGQGDVAAFLEWLAARDPARAHQADPPHAHEARSDDGAETRDTRG
jgi:hypothetical protein